MGREDVPMFQPSSAATTSEDERLMGGGIHGRAEGGRPRREHVVEGAGGGRVRRTSFPANSSTLESGAPIDRAKSFEYFPGESFPLQENSSSYEYLPGHMVSDRPGTVVSNHPQEEVDHTNNQQNGMQVQPHHRPESSASQATNGEDSTTSSIQTSSNGEVHTKKTHIHEAEVNSIQINKKSQKKRRQIKETHDLMAQTHSLAMNLNSLSNKMMLAYCHYFAS